MALYYAITFEEGTWKLVTSGDDPEAVYEQAENILSGLNEAMSDEDPISLSPDAEAMLNSLRVVPEVTARDVYHVVYTPEFEEED